MFRLGHNCILTLTPELYAHLSNRMGSKMESILFQQLAEAIVEQLSSTVPVLRLGWFAENSPVKMAVWLRKDCTGC